MYSRSPTTEESIILKTADAKIHRAVRKGNKAILEPPFSQIKCSDLDDDNQHQEHVDEESKYSKNLYCEVINYTEGLDPNPSDVIQNYNSIPFSSDDGSPLANPKRDNTVAIESEPFTHDS